MKILKIFLIITGAVLCILLVLGLVLILDWPWWMILFLLMGLLGLGAGLLFLRKMWLRNREQRFVQQIIEQDESSLKSLAGKEKDTCKELQSGWKEAIEALRKSRLRRYGNPLYVLPWYMVIGESGSGKTTALQSARLSSPFVEVKRTSGISGTRNCDWWFFEQAIILDTAGRYAIPVDEGRDKDEWQQFLTLLRKYRKRESLNGLIVTMAADKLLAADPEILEENGQAIRRRIEELMRTLGIKFPVYLLVTKCDLIQGMARFCDRLPEQSLDQAMGFINQGLSKDISALQDKAFESIGDRLRNLRLLLMHQPETKSADPGILLFPEELERLKASLSIFLRKIFQENPYQETPLLRGIFLSSGRQEGTPFSHFLQALGLIADREVLPGTNKGLFLHDFFAKILPKERGLFAPTQRAIEWKRVTRSFGLTSWVALMVAVCGLLSFSFVMNMKTLREVSHEFLKSPLQQEEMLPGSMAANIASMDRFRQSIRKVEGLNHNWWIPRFGLHQSQEVEIGLKDKYGRKFRKVFLSYLEEQINTRISMISPKSPDHIMWQYGDYLIRRIRLVKSSLEDKDFDTLQAKAQPSHETVIDQAMDPEMGNMFSTLYLHYLIWSKDSEPIGQELELLQQWLKHLLSVEKGNLHWLVGCVNSGQDLSSLTIEEFWRGNLPAAVSGSGEEKLPAISPAFTREGRVQVYSIMKDIESSLADPAIMNDLKTEFDTWYEQAYLKAWYDFGTAFPEGARAIKTRKDQQQIASFLASGQGPYRDFIERMTLELEPIAEGENVPPWVELIYQFQDVEEEAIKGDPSREKGTLAKTADKLADLGKKSIKRIGTKGLKISSLSSDSLSMASKAYLEYRNALAEIAPDLTSENLAFQRASQTFQEEQAIGKSPFYTGHRTIDRLKASMAKGRAYDEMFWKLISGPLDYLWLFVTAETGRYLQEQWENQVLAEIEGVSGWSQVQQLVLGQDGYVWKFTKGTAKPFMSHRYGKGYYSKEVLGRKIPFTSSFFQFLNKGATAVRAVEPSYTVTIKGLPTDASPGARLMPHATRLELHCGGEVQSMINLNYPISRTFRWSPENCGEVIFQIEVAEVTLTQKYSGDQAFVKFLHDFRKGERIFYSHEFPAERVILESYGLRYIKARYKFSGHQPILDLPIVNQIEVPRNIIQGDR